MANAPKQEYRVLRGLEWGSKRAEPDEIRSDIPAASIPWLLEDGLIEAVVPEKPAKSEKKTTPPAGGQKPPAKTTGEEVA